MANEKGAVGPLYHAGPDFNKFDISKVGTGTGRGARGHGLYFSSKEELAKLYKPEGGKLYKVNVNAEPEHFLDWDKPLAKQSERVKNVVRSRLKEEKYLRPTDDGPGQLQSAWKSYVSDHGGSGEGDVGGTIYDVLLNGSKDGKAASAHLSKAGVPGSRYQDWPINTSALQRTGKGSTHYVTFSDEGIDILEKGKVTLGMLGLSGAGAAGALTGGMKLQDYMRKKK